MFISSGNWEERSHGYIRNLMSQSVLSAIRSGFVRIETSPAVMARGCDLVGCGYLEKGVPGRFPAIQIKSKMEEALEPRRRA